MSSFFQQRSEGHVLGQRPVHRAVLDHLASAFQDATETWKCETTKSWDMMRHLSPRGLPSLKDSNLGLTSVDGEVLHGDRRGNLSDVVQVFFSQTCGGAAHGLGLSIQGEKTWEKKKGTSIKHKDKSLQIMSVLRDPRPPRPNLDQGTPPEPCFGPGSTKA